MDAEQFALRMQRLAEAALARWDLDVASVHPIKVRENAVYRVELAGGGRVALRVHRQGYHSDAALRSEFAWMRALGTAGIEVPSPVPSRDGRDFECVPDGSGTRQVDVFEWIDGRQLGSVEGSVQGDEETLRTLYRTIGATTARMHAQAAAWSRPAGFERHAWDAAGLVGEAPLWGRFWELAALAPDQRRLLAAGRERIAADLGRLGTAAARFGLIHADLVPENILVDGDRVRVIDFDDAGFGWRMFDLATSLYFISGESFYPLARDALVAGYRSVAPLPDEELARLPLFLAARSTTYLGWVHTRQETETARELTPYLVERSCAVVEGYLRGP
jgi:Ser/Thr protein kinase RdoA (MazF antagonist)